MQTAGYVLAGGASSRMGQNKALLTLGGRTLVEIVAAAVREAAGNVTIVGPPELYQHFGFPVIPDGRIGLGPLAGIETALRDTVADWSLVVACDMPFVNAQTLRRILDEAQAHPEAGCVLPESAEQWVEPLCAAYHKRSLQAITEALDAGTRKVRCALSDKSIHHIRMTGDPIFQNINTPEQWSELRRMLQRD